jgi:hypothetical protein
MKSSISTKIMKAHKKNTEIYNPPKCALLDDIFKTSRFINITSITLYELCTENFAILQIYQNQLETLAIGHCILNTDQFNQFYQMPKLKRLSFVGSIEINDINAIDTTNTIDNNVKIQLDDYIISDSDDEDEYEGFYRYNTLICEEPYKEYDDTNIVTQPITQLEYFLYKNAHPTKDTQETAWKVFKKFIPILTQVKTIFFYENRLCGTYLLRDKKALTKLSNIEELSMWFIEYPFKQLEYRSSYKCLTTKLPTKKAYINLNLLYCLYLILEID